jgi:hypothetical protein
MVAESVFILDVADRFSYFVCGRVGREDALRHERIDVSEKGVDFGCCYDLAHAHAFLHDRNQPRLDEPDGKARCLLQHPSCIRFRTT